MYCGLYVNCVKIYFIIFEAYFSYISYIQAILIISS